MASDSKNALNDVVSNLIRAAAGSSAKDVSDQDVDKYVADLILKEAEEKRKKYQKVGIEAYQPNGLSSKVKPKPNTRFLLNMVKATDSHNQAVIKANEDNVAKLRQERLERERIAQEKAEKMARKERERRQHRISSSNHSNDRHDDRHKEGNRRHHRHEYQDVSPTSVDSIKIERFKHNSPPLPSRIIKEDGDIQYKGRGKVRINVSSMDKYFSKGYDPLLDIDSDKEEYLFESTTRKKRLYEEEDGRSKKKHKSSSDTSRISSSSKKKKKKSSSSSSSSSSSKSKKKKSTRHDHKHYKNNNSSSSDSSSSSEEEPVAKPIRAWDVGKV